MAKQRRPAGNCPHCHQNDVRYVVTLADGELVMACGSCVDGYDRAEIAVESLS